MTMHDRFGHRSIGLNQLTLKQLAAWVQQGRCLHCEGQLPDYIPLLADVNPQTLAVQVNPLSGQPLRAGDWQQTFSLMSVVKPFLLLCLLDQLGQKVVFQHVGWLPSELPFNSLKQLQIDQGFPRNPMLNSGAIVLASLLPGADAPSRCQFLCDWLNQRAGTHWTLDQPLLDSVRAAGGEQNRHLANLLAQHNRLMDVETALDTYNQICCLSGQIGDLADLGLLLVQAQLIPADHRHLVNALMLTCGLYEASGLWAVKLGLPVKSGVSGAILGVVPGQGTIAIYSPVLDQAGNSIVGLWLLEQLARNFNLSVFL